MSLLAAVLTGRRGGRAGHGVTAGRRRPRARPFTVLFRLVLIPMTLFSGTFFPVERLPAWIQPLAWVSPLWHGTELARAAALGRWVPLRRAGPPGVPVVLLAVGAGLAVADLRRRLYR